MKNIKKKLVNKHFLNEVLLFIGVLIIVLTFINFLKEAQKKDKYMAKKHIEVQEKKTETQKASINIK